MPDGCWVRTGLADSEAGAGVALALGSAVWLAAGLRAVWLAAGLRVAVALAGGDAADDAPPAAPPLKTARRINPAPK